MSLVIQYKQYKQTPSDVMRYVLTVSAAQTARHSPHTKVTFLPTAAYTEMRKTGNSDSQRYMTGIKYVRVEVNRKELVQVWQAVQLRWRHGRNESNPHDTEIEPRIYKNADSESEYKDSRMMEGLMYNELERIWQEAAVA
jgi:hypothetical protein